MIELVKQAQAGDMEAFAALVTGRRAEGAGA